MSKEIVTLLIICLMIYHLCPQYTNASKIKLIKKFLKAKLIKKTFGGGTTKIVIPFIIPIPFGKSRSPHLNNAMHGFMHMTGGYGGYSGYPYGYDSRFNTLSDVNQNNNWLMIPVNMNEFSGSDCKMNCT